MLLNLVVNDISSSPVLNRRRGAHLLIRQQSRAVGTGEEEVETGCKTAYQRLPEGQISIERFNSIGRRDGKLSFICLQRRQPIAQAGELRILDSCQMLPIQVLMKKGEARREQKAIVGDVYVALYSSGIVIEWPCATVLCGTANSANFLSFFLLQSLATTSSHSRSD